MILKNFIKQILDTNIIPIISPPPPPEISPPKKAYEITDFTVYGKVKKTIKDVAQWKGWGGRGVGGGGGGEWGKGSGGEKGISYVKNLRLSFTYCIIA